MKSKFNALSEKHKLQGNYKVSKFRKFVDGSPLRVGLVEEASDQVDFV